jgi:hypothetical protein
VVKLTRRLTWSIGPHWHVTSVAEKCNLYYTECPKSLPIQTSYIKHKKYEYIGTTGPTFSETQQKNRNLENYVIILLECKTIVEPNYPEESKNEIQLRLEPY